jgi:hypothetical protein
MLLVALAFATGGCSRDEAQDDDTAAFEIVKPYEQDAVNVSLKVEHSKISVADRLRVVLEASAPESVDVELPGRPAKLGEFAVADFRAAQPRLADDGRVVHRSSWVLEPFLAGSYKLPPLTVRYSEKKPQGVEPGEISTEEIPVEVASVLTEGEEPQIKDIAAPLEMPAPWWPWAAGAAALAALLAGFYWWRKRKRLERDAVPPPAPHEVAYQELEKLLAAGLLEKGDAKLFYLRLSNVLRHYIEDRFGLRAPEQTTEEFLAELRRNQPFGSAHKERLQEFLEHCDLVKFAEMQPTRGEAETSVALCRRFIDETRHEESPAEEPVAT